MLLGELLRWVEPAWFRDAACREHPELSWFPTGKESSKPARQVCATCLVREQCSEFGADIPHGIWGGQRASKRQSAA